MKTPRQMNNDVDELTDKITNYLLRLLLGIGVLLIVTSMVQVVLL